MVERIDVALRILTAVISGASDPQDIARSALLPEAEVRRVLGDLERSGSLRRRPDGTLEPSGSILASLTSLSERRRLVDAASIVAGDLARERGIESAVWVRDSFLARRVLTAAPATGTIEPLLGVHSTPMHECAAGIALLAGAGREEIERYFALAGEEEDWGDARAQVDRCADAGWVAVATGGRSVEVAAAVPDGAAAPTVAVSLTSSRDAATEDVSAASAIGPRLRDAAATIARA